MHLALDDFMSAHTRAPLDLAYLLDQPLTALRPWLESRPDDWDFITRLADKIRSSITYLAAERLDWGVCHGDLTLDNVHVTEDNRFIFYDFDSGGPGWRAYDPPGVFQYAGSDRWDAFLRGYTEARRFGSTDLAAVPYFAAANGIWSMGNRARNWTAWSGLWLVNDAYLDQQLSTWRRWDVEQLGKP